MAGLGPAAGAEMTFEAEDNLETRIENAHSSPEIKVSPPRRSNSHVTVTQEPS